MATTWAFKIDDLASGPAGKMAAALEGFDSKLAAADVALKGFDSKLEASTSAMSKLDAVVRKTDPARTLAKQVRTVESESGAGKHGLLGKLLTGGVGGAIPELYFATELGSKIVHVGESFASAAIGASKFAIEQAAAKQQTLAAMTVMTGSADKAQRYYTFLQRFSDLTPFKGQDLQQTFQTLIGSGLNIPETTRALAAMADLGAAGGTGSYGIQRMGQSLMDMLATNRLDQRHIREFVFGSGGLLNEKRLFEEIGKAKGVSAESAKAMLSSGAIQALEGLHFIEHDIAENVDHGPLGKMAEKLGIGQLAGQVSTLQNRFERLFQDVDYSPVLGAVSSLNDLLDSNSDSGKRLKGTLDDLFGGTFKAFFAEYSGPQGAKALKRDFDSLVDSVQTLARVLEVAAATAGKLFHAAMWLYRHHVLDAAAHSLDFVPGGALVSGAFDAAKGAAGIQGKLDAQRHLAQSIADAAKLNPKLLDTPGTRDFLASEGIAVPLANAPAPVAGGPAIHVENHITVPADASKEHSDAVVKAVHEATVSTLTSAMEQAAHRRGVK